MFLQCMAVWFLPSILFMVFELCLFHGTVPLSFCASMVMFFLYFSSSVQCMVSFYPSAGPAVLGASFLLCLFIFSVYFLRSFLSFFLFLRFPFFFSSCYSSSLSGSFSGFRAAVALSNVSESACISMLSLAFSAPLVFLLGSCCVMASSAACVFFFFGCLPGSGSLAIAFSLFFLVAVSSSYQSGPSPLDSCMLMFEYLWSAAVCLAESSSSVLCVASVSSCSSVCFSCQSVFQFCLLFVVCVPVPLFYFFGLCLTASAFLLGLPFFMVFPGSVSAGFLSSSACLVYSFPLCVGVCLRSWVFPFRASFSASGLPDVLFFSWPLRFYSFCDFCLSSSRFRFLFVLSLFVSFLSV